MLKAVGAFIMIFDGNSTLTRRAMCSMYMKTALGLTI